MGSGAKEGVDSEAGGWTVRHKGVASEIEGGRRVGQRGMESEAEGGQKGVESEAGARRGGGE